MPLTMRIANNWRGVVANGDATVLARTATAAIALRSDQSSAGKVGRDPGYTYIPPRRPNQWFTTRDRGQPSKAAKRNGEALAAPSRYLGPGAGSLSSGRPICSGYRLAPLKLLWT